MTNLNRRSFLKNIAKMSSAAAMAPLAGLATGYARDHSIILNVALHGLFVLNIYDLGIELLTPDITEHRYHAGSWDFDKVYRLRRGLTHELRGVLREAQAPAFDNQVMPVFSKPACNIMIQRDKSFCRVILPFPAAFNPLRRCVADSSYQPEPCPPNSLCPGDPQYVCITAIALCPVLSYIVPDARELELTHTVWRPEIDPDTRSANLHLWAEPEERLLPDHADRAYNQLSDLVPPLQLKLLVYSTAPLDTDTGVLGFPREQEQGWSDWQGGGGEGGFPTNCCAMVAHNRSL